MVGSVLIRIETEDKMAVYRLLEPEDDRIGKGKSNKIAQGADITLTQSKIRKDIGPQVFEFALEVGTGVSCGVIGNYITERLKDSDIDSLEIGGEEVEVEENSIQEKLDKYTEE